MKNKNKNKKGIVLMVIGLILVVAAFTLTVYNIWDENRANTFATDMAYQLDDLIFFDEDEIPEYVSNPDMEMPTVEIDGREYIGILEIPCLEITLPIISRWSYDDLKYAPCRYQGSVYLDNMIIAGHNYSRHFGGLINLEAGDSVIFTDVSGNEFSYRVIGAEQLSGTAVEDMESGQWDLTLFTCTYSGQARVTVRCEREK